MAADLLLGIDVGTGSARAMLARGGRRVALAASPVRTWRAPELPDRHAEQSSMDIWSAVCAAVRAALAEACAAPEDVAGVAFCATCSLVALGPNDEPVSVSSTGRDELNVVLWADHRAAACAERITATGHDALRYVGGAVSAEMQLPKLMWLKENLSQHFSRAARFMDLSDFLCRRASGAATRSYCCAVCKWCYVGEVGAPGAGWDPKLFREVGLQDLLADGATPLGPELLDPGARAGGLTEAAAAELGLCAGTPVATGLIDAHCGALGLLGAAGTPVEGSLAVIAGTSNCLLALSRTPRFIPGVWGPYPRAVLPDWWCSEAGQSAAGSFLDKLVASHAAFPQLEARAAAQGADRFAVLEALLDEAAQRQGVSRAHLTSHVHVTPDWNGNRSPLARADMRGVVSGRTLEDDTLEALAVLYLAGVQALAYSTRMIVAELRAGGLAVDRLVVCGGLSHNPLFLRSCADALQVPVVVPGEPEAVLLGACMLAGVGSGLASSLEESMSQLRPAAAPATVQPEAEAGAFHDAKFEVFEELTAAQARHAARMQQGPWAAR